MESEVQDAASERIRALAERHELGEATADVLERYLRLLDWETGNFIPASAPELSEPNLALTDDQIYKALAMSGESLSALQLEPVRAAGRLADIGTGAGFPGLVLAIALPGTQVCLVEADSRKCGFLRKVVASLGIDNVEVVDLPLQSWTDGIGTCDVVTSRRVWRPHTILEHVAPLLAPNGVSVRFGGRDAEKEKLAQASAEANGMRFESVHPAVTETIAGGVRTGKRHIHMYRKVA